MPLMHAVSRLPPHAAAAAVAVFGGRGARFCSNATQSSAGGRRDFNLNSCPDEFEGAGLISCLHSAAAEIRPWTSIQTIPSDHIQARPRCSAGDGSCDEGGIGGCPDGAASVASLLAAVLTENYLYVTSAPVTK
eukprot:COSAG01_NODE_5226_length_4401_cov_5.008601_6_plen_134_part_00